MAGNTPSNRHIEQLRSVVCGQYGWSANHRSSEISDRSAFKESYSIVSDQSVGGAAEDDGQLRRAVGHLDDERCCCETGNGSNADPWRVRLDGACFAGTGRAEHLRVRQAIARPRYECRCTLITSGVRRPWCDNRWPQHEGGSYADDQLGAADRLATCPLRSRQEIAPASTETA